MAERSKRGFAAMSAQKQREIARRGGQAAHKKGTAHEFTSDEARIAGHRGGRALSSNRQYMSEIGRKGGHSSAGQRAAKSRQMQESYENGNGNYEYRENESSGTNERTALKATDMLRGDVVIKGGITGMMNGFGQTAAEAQCIFHDMAFGFP